MTGTPAGGFLARLALGTVQWGQAYGIANQSGVPSDSELEAMCSLAAEAGVRALDTARAYGNSEERIGRLLPGFRGFRVITKLTPALDADASVTTLEEVTRASIDSSLTALGRENLDGLMLHRAEHRHIGGGIVWQLLQAEQEAGRIGSLGVSATTVDEALEAIQDPALDIIQVAASLFDQRLRQAGFFTAAREKGIAVYTRSAYLQGAGFMQPDELPAHLDALQPALTRLRDWSAAQGLALDEVLLRYAGTLGGFPVVGCENREQVAAALRIAAAGSFDDAATRELEALIGELPDSVLDPWRWPA